MIRAKREVLHAHCADLRRDPAEILVSTHVQYDPAGGAGALADKVAALDGIVDLAIVYVPPPHRPATLEQIADALRPLA